jgi:hypothetical protein
MALSQLVIDVDRGRVYDRDRQALAKQLQEVHQAVGRRPAWSRRAR